MQCADEFEVSMFLIETSTRHSILTKHKHFRDKVPPRMQSNSTKLLGETSASPIDVDTAAPILREEDEDEVPLDKIPEAGDAGQNKRPREIPASGSEFEGDSDVESVHDSAAPPSKRAKQREAPSEGEEEEEDKKKMAMDISYEGFAIYGRVLCLVVKRREAAAGGRPPAAPAAAATAGQKPTGQAMMENWISSTQVPAGMEDETEVR